MYWDGNYKELGQYDVTKFVARLNELGEEVWVANTRRQQNPLNERHRETQSILMIYDEDLEQLHSPPTVHARFNDFKEVLQPVLDHVAAYYGGHGYFLRAFMPKLASGGIIRGHVDRAMSLINAHRIHMPLISDERVTFRVGGETRILKPGQIVEINNQRSHAAHNGWDQGRVHLLLDWVETDASGAPLKKPNLDIVISPERFDATCAQVTSLVAGLELEQADKDRMTASLSAMSDQWRRVYAEHGENVRARKQYLEIVEPVTGDTFLGVRNMSDWETPEADAFGRLFVTVHVLTKGLYAA